jgi:DNA-binding transcriptional ArsR family regulator
MVKHSDEKLDNLFHALADPTRRQLVQMLTAREHTVTELAAPFDMSLAAISKHLKVLEGAGLLNRTVQGRTHICRLDPASLVIVYEWLRFYERFWGRQLDALARELSMPEDNTPDSK